MPTTTVACRLPPSVPLLGNRLPLDPADAPHGTSQHPPLHRTAAPPSTPSLIKDHRSATLTLSAICLAVPDQHPALRHESDYRASPPVYRQSPAPAHFPLTTPLVGSHRQALPTLCLAAPHQRTALLHALARVRLQSLRAHLPAALTPRPHPGASPITEPPRSPTGSHRPHPAPAPGTSPITEPRVHLPAARPRLQPRTRPITEPPCSTTGSFAFGILPLPRTSLAPRRGSDYRASALTYRQPAPDPRCFPLTVLTARGATARCLSHPQPTSGRLVRPHRPALHYGHPER